MRTFFFLLTFLFSLNGHAAPSPMTAPALLEMHAKALGPIDKIHTRRVRLRIVGMAPFEIPVVVEASRPNLIRKEVSLQGSVQVTAFDGKQAWKTDPFVPGGATPSALPQDEARALQEEADFDGALVNPAAKGIRVAYAGPGTSDGKSVHALRVTLGNGSEATVLLDAASGLEVKRTQLLPVAGKMTLMDIHAKDYRVVDGVAIAHRIEIGLAGAREGMAILVDAVELNARLQPAKFARPAP